MAMETGVTMSFRSDRIHIRRKTIFDLGMPKYVHLLVNEKSKRMFIQSCGKEDDRVVDYVEAGKRVRAARLRLGMAQEMLASAADMSVQYLSHVENARSKASLTTFIKLANALHLTLNDLFCDSLDVSGGVFEKQIEALLKDCTSSETRFIAKTLASIMDALREHDKRNHRCE